MYAHTFSKLLPDADIYYFLLNFNLESWRRLQYTQQIKEIKQGCPCCRIKYDFLFFFHHYLMYLLLLVGLHSSRSINSNTWILLVLSWLIWFAEKYYFPTIALLELIFCLQNFNYWFINSLLLKINNFGVTDYYLLFYNLFWPTGKCCQSFITKLNWKLISKYYFSWCVILRLFHKSVVFSRESGKVGYIFPFKGSRHWDR